MDSDNDSDDLNGGAVDEDSSESSDDEEYWPEEHFMSDLQRIRDNDPHVTKLEGDGGYEFIQNITNEQWQEFGRDISNNTHLESLHLYDGALNDDTISYLFRGLTRSNSLEEFTLYDNRFSIAGVRSLVPFLQNANNLRTLYLSGSNIHSDGFNVLCRALRDSPIEKLQFNSCGIESIEIDINYFPRHVKELNLSSNNINADGCREITKLLSGGDSTLTYLNLINTKLDDEGVAILVDALLSNTSLTNLMLLGNKDMSLRGRMLLLKLVNDISSVKATLQSNHTLRDIIFDQDEEVHHHFNMAREINENHVGNPEAAGREKVIQTQLRSATRAELARLQGVSHSVYSEINPLHLPEVLSLVGRRHGQEELYIALKSSIAEVISVVNRRQCIVQQLAYHEAKSAELRAELAVLDATGGDAMDVGNEVCSNKRHRSR